MQYSQKAVSPSELLSVEDPISKYAMCSKFAYYIQCVFSFLLGFGRNWNCFYQFLRRSFRLRSCQILGGFTV